MKKSTIKPDDSPAPKPLNLSAFAITTAVALLAAVIVNQLILVFGDKAGIADGRLVPCTAAAMILSLTFCFSFRNSLNKYWTYMTGEGSPWIMWAASAIIIITSTMNLMTIELGLDEDEFLEFTVSGFHSYRYGWIFWSGPDETLSLNSAALLGRLIGIRFETFKITAFLFRTAAAFAAMFLARELFGRRIAAMTAIIISTSIMYMCSFNILIKESPVPAVFLSCLFFTFRGIRIKSISLLALGGIFAGLSFYTYTSKLSLWPVLLLWPALALAAKDPVYSIKGPGLKWVAWILCLIIVSLPFFYYTVQSPHYFISLRHAESQSSLHQGGFPLLIKNTWLECLAIVFRGDNWYSRNFASAPFLWWPLASMFWIGLAAMLWKIKESRVFIILLLMAGALGLGGSNNEFTPNFKLSRTGLFLSAIPCAIGINFVIELFGRIPRVRWLRFFPAILFTAAALHAYQALQQVEMHPASRWFFCRHPMKQLEEFVYSHPEFRFWGVTTSISDLTEKSPVRPVPSLRAILETPSDGRAEVFLFRAGRQEYIPQLNTFINLLKTLYPEGIVELHTVPFSGGEWPSFVSYRVPKENYWSLPELNDSQSRKEQAAVLIARASLLNSKSLQQESLRDAIKAAHLDSSLYSLIDEMFHNQNGTPGRIKILLSNRLWEEARDELTHQSTIAPLSPFELEWKKFLDSHGLFTTVYSTYEESESVIATFRLYFPDMYIGDSGARFYPNFSVSAEGCIYIPETADYSFGFLSGGDTRMAIYVDGVSLAEISRRKFHNGQKPPSYRLKKGMHSFKASTALVNRFTGEAPVPSFVPDILSSLYGFDQRWHLTWGVNGGPQTLIPPQHLYMPDTQEPVQMPSIH